MSAKEFDMLPVKTRNIMRYFFRQKAIGMATMVFGGITTGLAFVWKPAMEAYSVSAGIILLGWEIFKSEKPLLII